MNIGNNPISMIAHQSLMNNNANNIANVNSDNFSAKDAHIENNLKVNLNDTEKPTNLTQELTNQIIIEDGFNAQVPAIKIENEMMGTILNMKI